MSFLIFKIKGSRELWLQSIFPYKGAIAALHGQTRGSNTQEKNALPQNQ
jgi:hypothetical protein